MSPIAIVPAHPIKVFAKISLDLNMLFFLHIFNFMSQIYTSSKHLNFIELIFLIRLFDSEDNTMRYYPNLVIFFLQHHMLICYYKIKIITEGLTLNIF